MQHKGTKMEHVKEKLREVENRARSLHSCVIITAAGGKNKESAGMQYLQKEKWGILGEALLRPRSKRPTTC